MRSDEDQVDRVREVKERFAVHLMEYPNVTGVGVGLRIVDGQARDEPCVRVYVRRKVPEEALPPGDVLPRTLGGVAVDVVEGEFDYLQQGVADLTLEQRRFRHFPFLTAGVSVGSLRVTAGTFGAVAYDLGSGGQQLMLSNWHILCGHPDCLAGEPIVQPGPAHGGAAPKDTVAALHRFANTDSVDAAVAVISGWRFCSEVIPGIGLLRGVREAVLGMRVRKSGARTGVTGGIVDDISADISLRDGSRYLGQISVVPEGPGVVALGGDSGSLVVDNRGVGVGLLFAGRIDGRRYLANHIQDVVSVLGIRLTPEPTPLQAFTTLAVAVG